MANNRVIIVGGGLAGLTAAVHLSRSGKEVTLIEKQHYPKHKVCGEYVSNEVLPYLESLGVDLSALRPAHISKASFSTAAGEEIHCSLPLGGLGISRYRLDHHLFGQAIANGCTIVQEAVSGIDFSEDQFTVTLSNGETLTSKVVLGAYGKRSNIDFRMQRDFLYKDSQWLAVKAHYSGNYPEDLVGLHHFDGGYCGVSTVEDGVVNVCYLADFQSFKKFRNIDDYQAAVVCRNPVLKELFDRFVPLFDHPITISQISFGKKEPVCEHLLMIGDTAGLIHPMCGNGMAMAIHSAKMASENIVDFLEERINRTQMEKRYAEDWARCFSARIKVGKMLAAALQKRSVSKILLKTLVFFPSLLPKIIKLTHGKPLKLAA